MAVVRTEERVYYIEAEKDVEFKVEVELKSKNRSGR